MDSPDGVRNPLFDELGERLERFRLLTEGDEAERDAILAEIDVRGDRETTMVAELASRVPVAFPENFPPAHRLVMRAMEVLARHGFRSPQLPRWAKAVGPLASLLRWMIELVGRFITLSYLTSLINALRDLYGRREAQSLPLTAERRMLQRARLDVERLSPGFKSNAIGVPTVLLGSISVPVTATLARVFTGVSWTNRTFLVAGGVVAFLITGLVSWVVLRGAAMAHRRIQLAARAPVQALWETIGSCGRPPRDASMTFAYASITLTFVGWIVLPVAVAVAVAVL